MHSAVSVFVADINGRAAIRYECTAGEVVRFFGLDVAVSQGRIIGITNFFRGPSTGDAQGYGIFPAAFRDHITVSSGTNANWSVAGYTPLAVVADDPANTLPGLGSSGVTLELGAFWDLLNPASVPPAAGTLCWLQLSEAAQVTVAANASRGGVISALSGAGIAAVFTGAAVDPVPAITGIHLSNGTVTIAFKGGELESAPTLDGAWTGTGNSTGTFTTSATGLPAAYFRVNHH